MSATPQLSIGVPSTLSTGFQFTAASLTVTAISLTASHDRASLVADELTSLSFQSSQYQHDAVRDVMTTRTRHRFTFALGSAGWMLLKDEEEQHPDGGPAPTPGTQIAPAQAVRVGEGPASGRGLARPVGAGWYDWSSAGRYAYTYAISRNPAYRSFGDLDCTNFVSQALRAGGWYDTGGFKWDWNEWWYSSNTQTESWTYVPALKQFMSTSGRAQFMGYLTDMLIGDVIQVDFNSNGSMDHSMMVDDRISADLSGIFVSYHSTDTRDRPLSDFLSEKPIPGNSYWAEHIVGTY